MPDTLLDLMLEAAIAAAVPIMDVYSREIVATHKADGSPVTEADQRAEAVILAHLARTRLPVLAEESVAAGRIPELDGRFFVVDPLDGTKEFLKRNGEFTVNIALIEDGAPILGVVHAPVHGITYLAARGIGAFRIRGGERQPIHTRRTAERPVLVVSKSHRDAALDEFLAHAPPHDALSRGSSLKFCLIAEGSADLYPRTGPTSEWDTAAGHCVAEQAGAEVCTLPDWAPLRYNQKADLLNPGFIVIGEPAYGWRGKLRAA